MQCGTLLLNRDDLSHLLAPEEYLEIVASAFRAHATGGTLLPGLLHVKAADGEFHVKVGGITLDHSYFALKSNGGFFDNAARYGMPPIQGVILLCDADNGYPLALMDSTAITIARTAATTAIAARRLARANSHTVTICGCGNQGRAHLEYITRVLPIERAFVWDADRDRAREFAADMKTQLGIRITPAADLGDAVRESDVCITCTPAHTPYLHVEHVPDGMFLAAIGADSPEKQELDAALLARTKVVVDLVDQCASVGELHHALAAGLMTVADVHADLGDVLTGRKCGRTSDDEIIIYDATGTALQDTAAAAAAFAKARSRGTGSLFDFFSRV